MEGTQADDPIAIVMLPEVQGVQDADVLVEIVLSGQGVQISRLPRILKLPAGHATQSGITSTVAAPEVVID